MRRSTKVQLALFVALALFILPVGTRYALGAQFLSLGTIGLGDRPIEATAYFDDGRGLGPGTVVTYQGVVVGEIQTVRPIPPSEARVIETEDGPVTLPIEIKFRLDPGVEVVRTVTPVSTTLNVAGLVNFELRPTPGSVPGDYLQSGDELIVDPSLQRVSFREVLVAVNEVVDTLDVESLSALLEALGATFEGRGDDIGDIIDNVGIVADVFEKHSDTVEWLGTQGPSTMRLMADASDTMPSSFSTFRVWSRQLLDARPDIESLIDTGPGAMRRVSDLLADNRGNIEGTLDGFADVLPILSDRESALIALMDDFPDGLNKAATIARGNALSFTIVGTQGPVCYYETPRRAIGVTNEQQPNRAVFCPPGQDLAQRGAATAPRPDGLGLVGYTSPGIQTGPAMVSNPLIIGPGGRAALDMLGDAAREAGLIPQGGR
ncbi:MCE family protein [Hoyosella rhizosphaerae]|uniref:MCE family protein n=1 Tax=Hoyosella rhizosphaerae TaxID=1755582 RepID=A0A916UMI9_9ACTN|nr:MCE family protein [Hoyosella rhizosphaerae]MBN4925485.1 MCE family protein [Hoyosella rhizosphaerae]GGC77390.1 hypothetical protein GCM10011410_33400 [Hoyosella rhizosphaerae]